MFYKYYIFLCILILNSCDCDENVEVNLVQGVLSGTLDRTLFKQQEYIAFKGIPYALPPVGELRFLPPKPHQGWEGTYEAYSNKPTCLQLSSRMRNGEPHGISGVEDCLYLSVFTPAIHGTFPVVIFDYTDNFRTGFNGTDTYSPDFFIEEDVLVVTINHRLGVFGYFTTEDEVIPPNAGLKDFILALQWVKDNIIQFGGDPDRVTLMGSRGGASLAHMLLYSEKAKGLFSGVIMQSGSALEAIYFPENMRQTALKLGEKLEVTTKDSATLLKELQKIDPEQIITLEASVIDNEVANTKQMSIFPFSPTIEKENANAVLTSLPENSGIVNHVPIIIGFNSREGLDLVSHFIFEPRLVTDVQQSFLFHFPIRPGFSFDRNSSIFEKALTEIREFYLGDGYLHYKNILEYAVYVGDILQNYALDSTVNKLAKELSSPLYYYMFDFRGTLNENSEYMARRARSSMKHWGATIGDELCYLHVCTRIIKNYKEQMNMVSEQAEVKVLKKMVRLWTNFIKTGNPTPDKEDKVLNNFTWKPVNKNVEKKPYLHISKFLKMKENPLEDRNVFWDKFLKKYSEMAVDGIVQSHDRDEL